MVLNQGWFCHQRDTWKGLDIFWGFPSGASGKEPACRCRRHETWIPALDWEDPLEEGTLTYSRILAWRIPWTDEPHGLWSIGSQRVRHD